MNESRCIVVTGGSRGIGSSIVRNLAGRGFKVACVSRKGQGVEDVQVPSDLTGRIHAYAGDITEASGMEKTLAAIAESHGQIHGLVNNAGIHLDGPSAEFAAEDFDKVLHTNVIGPFRVSQLAYPYLKASGGMIINIGSFYDRSGVPGNAAYCASKAAVGAVSRCLAVEWARDGIRVVNVAPGFVATDLNREYLEQEKFQRYLRSRIPVQRAAQPDEIGQLVGAVLVENMPFLTGETIYVDGGQGVTL